MWVHPAAAAEAHHQDHVIKCLYANKEQQRTEVSRELAPLGVTQLELLLHTGAPGGALVDGLAEHTAAVWSSLKLTSMFALDKLVVCRKHGNLIDH